MGYKLSILLLIGNANILLAQQDAMMLYELNKRDKILKDVLSANSLLNLVGQKDTIQYLIRKHNIQASYGNSKLSRLLLTGRIIEIDNLSIFHLEGHTGGSIKISINHGRNKSTVFKEVYSMINVKKSKVEVFNYDGDCLSGEYKQFDGKGVLVVVGKYCSEDSMHNETEIVIDPESYETERVIQAKNCLSFKSGIWKYYDSNGQLTKTISYENTCGKF